MASSRSRSRRARKRSPLRPAPRPCSEFRKRVIRSFGRWVVRIAQRPNDPTTQRPNDFLMNILFIVVDTLRADHLGCYGYGKPTSPAIDRLASEGVLFERCYAPGIPTTPAHTTMYTGMHPLSHNIVCHGGSVELDRKIPVLPELLQWAGYTTCAVDNLFDIKPWLARGYEFYINPSHRHKMRLLVSADEINRRAIPWLKAHAGEPFFLFVHYWEPH